MYRFCVVSLCVALAGLSVMGCGKSKDSPSSGVFASEHFVSLKSGGGHATDQLLNGQRVGDGLIFWGLPTSVSGNNAIVPFTAYFGPFGTDDNTVQPGEQPLLYPNYADGAENNRPASHYDPVFLNGVAGTNNQLWAGTITTFPTNGRFVFTLARNRIGSNVTYAAGQHRDSSFDFGRQSLQAWFDPSATIIRTPGRP